MKGVTNTKPVSKHVMRHKNGRRKGILELSFTVDRNGVQNSGRAFTFCLQVEGGKYRYFLLILFALTVHLDARDILTAEEPYDNTDWISSMTCARTWLSQCLRSHHKCQTTHCNTTKVHTLGGRERFIFRRVKGSIKESQGRRKKFAFAFASLIVPSSLSKAGEKSNMLLNKTTDTCMLLNESR